MGLKRLRASTTSPPVHGMLAQMRRFTRGSPRMSRDICWMTWSRSLMRVSCEVMSSSLVHLMTVHPLACGLAVSPNLESGLQHTSRSTLSAPDGLAAAAGSPRLLVFIFSPEVGGIETILRSFSAKLHFSALVNGLVRMSAAWSIDAT